MTVMTDYESQRTDREKTRRETDDYAGLTVNHF